MRKYLSLLIIAAAAINSQISFGKTGSEGAYVSEGYVSEGYVAEVYIAELSASADQQQLWFHPEWISLLHYNELGKNLFSKQAIRYTTFIDDEGFFLSSDGSSNPKAELVATLTELFSVVELGDEHAQCRFPARLDWLSTRLNIDRNNLPKTDCALYQEWSDMVNAGSVVLVFPAHHLNSPSSMFGHTLLRLDPSEEDQAKSQQSDWLSYGVNFGANVPADDNSLLYAFRGLTGGYPGQFIVESYFKKIQEYNRIENRDIWEYPLNLTPEETRRLVIHLWELKDINFDYFFFTENCSYRLLELLEIARPSAELTDDFVVSAIPIDTIRSVERGGFIVAKHYRPAMTTELQHQLKSLPAHLHPLVAELVKNPKIADQDEFQAFAENVQYRMLETAYQALRYQQAKQSRDQEAAKHSLALLTKLSHYPIQAPTKIATPASPENSHQSKRLAITRGRDDHKNYSELKFRMAYHGLLDNRYGFLTGAQINIANVAIRHYDDNNVKLERLDLADIFSLTPRNAFFDRISWRIYGGLERVQVADQRPLATHITGGGGYAIDLNGSTLFTLLNARVEHNREFNDPAEVALGGQFGWLYHNPLGSGSVIASGLKFSGDEQRIELNIEQNIVLSINHALRIKVQRRWYDSHTASEFSLGYHYFFR